LLKTRASSRKISRARSVLSGRIAAKLVFPSSTAHHRGSGMPENRTGAGNTVRCNDFSGGLVPPSFGPGSMEKACQSSSPPGYSGAVRTFSPPPGTDADTENRCSKRRGSQVASPSGRAVVTPVGWSINALPGPTGEDHPGALGREHRGRAQAQARVRAGDHDRAAVLIVDVIVAPSPHVRMPTPGRESIFATNYLGHAALTWLLMSALRAGDSARVVTVSSIAHRGKGFDVEDLGFEHRRFRMVHAYAQSKLAGLMFALELQERLRAEGSAVLSAAAHPGFTGTELAAAGARNQGLGAAARPSNAVAKALSQSVPRRHPADAVRDDPTWRTGR
jgi:NAD(P)-dependent dehydrogenase (short-subunit alcohol dehydrogenase family)